MRIQNFNSFSITEKLGISKPSLQFVDLICDHAISAFEDFIDISDQKWDNKMEKIPYRLIRPYILDLEIYEEFPVVSFEIVYNFSKLTENQFSVKFPRYLEKDIRFDIGGWAVGYGHKNWKWYSKFTDPKKNVTDKGIIVQIGIDIKLNKEKFDYTIDSEREKVKDGIKSTIWHELNHSFEHYVRTIKGDRLKRVWDRSFNTAITWAAENRYNFPKSIWRFWDSHFLYYTYISEKHELRSNIQEMGYFIKNYPNKDIKTFDIYKNAESMISFDSYAFYHLLLKKISEHETLKGKEKSIAETLKKMWVDVYKRQCENQKAVPLISFNTLDEMTCLEFLRWWGKKINSNGRYLKEKILKLKYGINNEEI